MAFYIFPKAIPPDECNKYLKYCLKNAKWEDASTVAKGYRDVARSEDDRQASQEFDYKKRKTDVSFITDKNNIMNELVWDFIRKANNQYFNYNLNYFQAIQFAKYQNGGHYEWHQDGTADIPAAEECRKLSLTMSLTDHTTYDGGLLEFYNGERPYDESEHNVSEDIKAQGSVVVFDSRDWHRVTPVTKGVRYSIVCWTVGPNFI